MKKAIQSAISICILFCLALLFVSCTNDSNTTIPFSAETPSSIFSEQSKQDIRQRFHIELEHEYGTRWMNYVRSADGATSSIGFFAIDLASLPELKDSPPDGHAVYHHDDNRMAVQIDLADPPSKINYEVDFATDTISDKAIVSHDETVPLEDLFLSTLSDERFIEIAKELYNIIQELDVRFSEQT